MVIGLTGSMSARAVQVRTQISHSTIADMRSGNYRPRASTIERFAQKMGVDASPLLVAAAYPPGLQKEAPLETNEVARAVPAEEHTRQVVVDPLETRRTNERYAIRGHTPGPLFVRIPAATVQGDAALDVALVPVQAHEDGRPLVIGEFFGRVAEEGADAYINARANADLAAIAFDPEIGIEASWRDLAQMREENVALREFLERMGSQLNTAMALNKDVLEELKLLTDFVNGKG